MMTMVAILIFAAAFVAAATSIYATVRPSLPKIYAALLGENVHAMLPPTPPRRSLTLRIDSRQATVRMEQWRAAA